MKRTGVFLWPLLPCLVVSWLIHSTEDDVGGIVGVASSPSLWMSVVIWALPLALCAYLGLAAYLAGGPIAFTIVAGVFSGALGYFLARLGSTATTAAGFAWSVVGSSFLFLLAFSLAALPSGVIARKQRAREIDEHVPA